MGYRLALRTLAVELHTLPPANPNIDLAMM
jgi:hypothetical protein